MILYISMDFAFHLQHSPGIHGLLRMKVSVSQQRSHCCTHRTPHPIKGAMNGMVKRGERLGAPETWLGGEQ